MTTEGVKYDTGKPRYDLIPAEPLEALAQVYTMGASKYADRNWEKGLKWSRVFAAIMRHLWAFWRGEETDKESGLPHVIHAAWGCFALAEFMATKRTFDDRPTSYTYYIKNSSCGPTIGNFKIPKCDGCGTLREPVDGFGSFPYCRNPACAYDAHTKVKVGIGSTLPQKDSPELQSSRWAPAGVVPGKVYQPFPQPVEPSESPRRFRLPD